MKAFMIAIAASVILTSCFTEGPEGPMGPPGADGNDGLIATTLDYENVDFLSPDYEHFIEIPGNVEILPSDVVMVYALWEINEEVGDIWRPLPHLWFTEFGVLNFNFDFSTNDVRLFLEGEFNLDQLDATFTDDWIIRLVIIPGGFINGRVGKVDYEYLKNEFNLPEFESSNMEEYKKRR